MKYRTVQKNEYESLAKLHSLAFNDFFLTTLGDGFLKTYYKAALKSKESIAVCAVDDDGSIVGFSTGCLKSKGFHKKLFITNFAQFSFQALHILFSNPKALLRLLNNMDKKANPNDDGNYSELLSIAVSPLHKGLGIGNKIIKTFEMEASNKGCNKIALTTDYTNNHQVLSFYKKSGYVVFYEFITYPNRRMYKYIKELT